MELKKIKSNETKEDVLDEALRQIQKKRYDAEIIKRGINNIVKLAVTFDGMRVWAKEANN